jgi:hypothetical protein
MSKNGLNKHIAEESRKDLEPSIAPPIDRLAYHQLELLKQFAAQKTFTIKDDGIAYAKCNHKWKKYTGLSESFTYCEVCDEKK